MSVRLVHTRISVLNFKFVSIFRLKNATIFSPPAEIQPVTNDLETSPDVLTETKLGTSLAVTHEQYIHDKSQNGRQQRRSSKMPSIWREISPGRKQRKSFKIS